MYLRNSIIVFVSFLTLLGCKFSGIRGSGDLSDEVRKVDDFEMVELAGAFNVEIFVGRETSIEIEADDNLLELISTKVSGSKLIVDTKKNVRPKNDINIKIYTPSLIKVESSGASSVDVHDIQGERFQVEMSGAGNIALDGSVAKFRVDLSGAGTVSARELIAESVKVSISGACSAVVYASEFLSADVSGVGSVDYYGDPEEVDSNISGVGSINRK